MASKLATPNASTPTTSSNPVTTYPSHAVVDMGIERSRICGLDRVRVRETIPFARTLNRSYP